MDGFWQLVGALSIARLPKMFSVSANSFAKFRRASDFAKLFFVVIRADGWYVDCQLLEERHVATIVLFLA